MTFGECQTYVLDRLAITAGDTAKVTQIKNLLNAVRDRLVEKYELNVAVATVAVSAGASTGTVPADWMRPLYVRNGGILVDVISDTEFGALEAVAAGAGVSTSVAPAVYMWRPPSTIQVIPAPSVAVSLSIPYVQRPATMSAAGDAVTAIPSEYHDLLCELVAVRIGLSEGLGFEPQMEVQIAGDLDQQLRARRNRMDGPVGNRVRLKVYG